MTLGSRIRRVRTQQQTTLEKLSKMTELTISFLSQVERDVVSPSVESLQKIAKALGANVGDFFEAGDRRDRTLIRQAERLRVTDAQGHATIETLAIGSLQTRLEPKLISLDVGGKLGGEFSFPMTAEAFGFVLEGSVNILQGDEEPLMLVKGDSVCLKNPRPYHLVNEGDTKAEILWITFTISM